MDEISDSTSDGYTSEITEEFLLELSVNFDRNLAREKLEKMPPNLVPTSILDIRFMALVIDHVVREAFLLDVSPSDAPKRVFSDLKEKALMSKVGISQIMVQHLLQKPRDVAKSGGMGRAAKLKVVEEETIRLYKARIEQRNSRTTPPKGGKREGVPQIAHEITPLIVEFSRQNGTNLLSTTIKPLEWIRAYVKTAKSNLS